MRQRFAASSHVPEMLRNVDPVFHQPEKSRDVIERREEQSVSASGKRTGEHRDANRVFIPICASPFMFHFSLFLSPLPFHKVAKPQANMT